jgi:hypothetical protein
MKKHFFDSTADAYDASQCDESVKRGDLLIIVSEEVVGVSDTWPISATKSSGELHIIKSFSTIEDVMKDSPFEKNAVIAGYYCAVVEAYNRGWELNLDVDDEYIEQRDQEAHERFVARSYGDCNRPI